MKTQKRVKILLVSRNKTSLSALKTAIDENQVQTTWAQSSNDAIVKIAEGKFNLVVIDENLGDMTGIELIEKIVLIKPTANCAVISSLSPADFHEASEGLGILMQLPAAPGHKQAEKLLSQLKAILHLAKQGGSD